MRQGLIITLAHFVCSFALLCLISTRSSAQSERPNIVVFLVDDLGWTDLGCYGSDFYQTPHVDALAAEGTRFTNAYAACTVCSPTRAAIMSGQVPARLNLTDWITGHRFPKKPLLPPDWTQYLSLETQTLAEYLKEGGYLTASIGKWHLGEDSIYEPQFQGFDINVAGYNKGQPPSYFFPYQRKKWKRLPHLPGGSEGEYLTYRLTEEANNFIRSSAAQQQPFFLYLAHYTVHTPLQAPDSLVQYYTDQSDSTARHQHPTYAAMVHSMDQSLGSIRAVLDSLGAWENTLFIFASDNGGLSHAKWANGPTDNFPLRAGKGSAYEGGVRTPLIIHYPGDNKAQAVDLPVISMDIFYTALAAANVTPSKNLADGISLWDLQASQTAYEADRPLYWHYPHYHHGGATPYSAIRVGPYKLIEFYEDGRQELYHLTDDLGEQNNLAGSMPRLTKKLSRRLSRWKKHVSAQPPILNPDATTGN